MPTAAKWSLSVLTIFLAMPSADSPITPGVASPGNVIAAGGELLMIHPLKDGNVEVVPKTAAALRQIPPGDIASREATKHTLNLKAGTTYLFEVTQ